MDGIATLSGDTGERVVKGSVKNYGTFKRTNTNAIINGAFLKSGAYISDPSEKHFNDLIIEATGYLTRGLENLFSIAGDFINHRTNFGNWNTTNANLAFTGVGIHDFKIDPAGLSFVW